MPDHERGVVRVHGQRARHDHLATHVAGLLHHVAHSRPVHGEQQHIRFGRRLTRCAGARVPPCFAREPAQLRLAARITEEHLVPGAREDRAELRAHQAGAQDADSRGHRAWYCASLTCSIQSTAFPLSCSWTAMCVMAVVAVSSYQSFSPGGVQTTSPGRISSAAPPQRCARPLPAVTISVWPSGCVCHAVLAPGSNVTAAATTRAGSGAWTRGSMRTAPVNHSAGPFPEDR